ncbi:MAG: hypothetical protein ACERLG_11100 [Sedimentibacter sp.]
MSAFEIVKYKIDYWKVIEKLMSYDLIMTESITVGGNKTQQQVLALRKYAIRNIDGKDSSSSVAAVPKSSTNERFLVSMFKTELILKKVIPIIKNDGLIYLKVFD